MLLAAEWALARGGLAHALVVDHGLRAGSDGEATWTAELLQGLGHTAEVLTLSLPPGAAVQERARAGRMDAMLARCATLGLPWLLMGQHRADQAETVLFRALRGSGEAGLAGMAAARPRAEALLLRPLLDVPPVRLEAFLARRGLVPLRDPSNMHPRFTRARLRAALADPDGTGPGVAALVEAGAAFAARSARRNAAVRSRLAMAFCFRPEGFAMVREAELGRDDIARLALAGAVRLVSGEEHAPAEAAVAALLARGRGTLHGTEWRDGWLFREAAACAPAVPAASGTLWDRRWRVRSAPMGMAVGAVGGGVSRAQRRGLPARVVAGLPGLWREGRLEGIPALGLGMTAELVFAPSGGPLG